MEINFRIIVTESGKQVFFINYELLKLNENFSNAIGCWVTVHVKSVVSRTLDPTTTTIKIHKKLKRETNRYPTCVGARAVHDT